MNYNKQDEFMDKYLKNLPKVPYGKLHFLGFSLFFGSFAVYYYKK